MIGEPKPYTPSQEEMQKAEAINVYREKLEKVRPTLGAEKYITEEGADYDVDKFSEDLRNSELELAKIEYDQEFMAEEGQDTRVGLKKSLYALTLDLKKGGEETFVQISNYNSVVLLDDAKEIFKLAAESLKSAKTLEEAKSEIEGYIEALQLNNIKMNYSRDLKLTKVGDENHFGITDPESGETIPVYQTAYAGPHYLKGNSKNGDRSVTVYNRWNDSNDGEYEFEGESVQWMNK